MLENWNDREIKLLLLDSSPITKDRFEGKAVPLYSLKSPYLHDKVVVCLIKMSGEVISWSGKNLSIALVSCLKETFVPKRSNFFPLSDAFHLEGINMTGDRA